MAESSMAIGSADVRYGIRLRGRFRAVRGTGMTKVLRFSEPRFSENIVRRRLVLLLPGLFAQPVQILDLEQFAHGVGVARRRG